jgi:hypothetical protein
MVRARSHLSLDKEGKFRRRKASLLSIRLHEPNGQLFGSDFGLTTYSPREKQYQYKSLEKNNKFLNRI